MADPRQRKRPAHGRPPPSRWPESAMATASRGSVYFPVKIGTRSRFHHRRDIMSTPRLAEIGEDLTESTLARRYVAVAIPLLCVGGFFWSALAGLWPLSIFCVMAYSFFSYGSTSHDLVHGNLGFGPRENAFWLSLIELLGLRS